MKKLLCTLLAMAMIISMMVVVVAAEGEEETAGFVYPTYTTPEEFPISSPGPGLVAAVIMKPDDDLVDANGENAGKFSRVRFIFTGENNMAGYNCHWGVGHMNADGTFRFNMGDSGHYLGHQAHYGTGDYFFWKNDANGYKYFELVIVNAPNENGKWYDETGAEYDTMYDMAKAGKLLATYGEHEDPNGPGVVNGLFNNDAGNFSGNMFANYPNPFGGFDSITVRMVTEEQYYVNGDRTQLPNEEFNTLAAVVAHAPDGKTKYADGMDVCKVSFVFDGWKGDGYEIAWGIALLPQDENGMFLQRPEFADQYTWYNCDGDANIILEDGTELDTNWSQFTWFEDAKGDVVFQVTFAMPSEVIKAAGYDNLEHAAAMGALIGSVREHRGEGNGIIDCGNEGQAPFRANAVQSNGLDAVIVGGVSGCEYYGEELPIEIPDVTTEEETEAPTTTAPVVDGTTAAGTTAPAGTEAESKPTTTDEGGCASTIGLAALALAALCAAPVAFKKH